MLFNFLLYYDNCLCLTFVNNVALSFGGEWDIVECKYLMNIIVKMSNFNTIFLET
jgi:hypothetical protein